MSGDKKHNKLIRKTVSILGSLLLLVMMLLLIITDHPMRPLQPWNFYLRLLITAFIVLVVLIRIVASFRSEGKVIFTLESLLQMIWLLLVIGAYWYGPLMVLGLLLVLAIRIPAIVSYFRGVFATFAKSYRELSKSYRDISKEI